MNNQKYNVDI